MSLAALGWPVSFFGTVIFDPSDIDGASDVITFLVGQAILTGFWLSLYFRVRGNRRGPSHPSARAARRLVLRALLPPPYGQHALASDPTGPRTALSSSRINATSWPKRMERQDIDLPEDGSLARLAVAEQALGNALYELDLRRGSHPLTRERIAALRVTGLEASAWLTTQADLAVYLPRGKRPAATAIQDGVRRYTDLAREAENFLAGKVGVARLDSTREALARSSG
jgi:hypothetical protein